VFKNTNYKSVASHSRRGRGKNASARHACTDRQSKNASGGPAQGMGRGGKKEYYCFKILYIHKLTDILVFNLF